MDKSEKNKIHYQKNKPYFQKYYKKYHEERRIIVLKHYTPPFLHPSCKCCGENELDFLTIDHIDNNGYKHRKEDKSAKNIYQWIIKNNFPSGFQVLCMNCNLSKGKNGECVHKV